MMKRPSSVKSPSSKSKKRRRLHETAEERNSVQGKISLHKSPWSNLKIITFLQNREIELARKIGMALRYVESMTSVGESEEEDDSHQTVKRSRLVKFLSEWVQSLLVSGNKKVDANESLDPCLDYRCWMVFEFCLKDSLKLNVRLGVSRNLLRVIGFVARSEQFTLKQSCLPVENDTKLRQFVVDCVALVFLSHDGVSNGNLDLWISAIFPVLDHLNDLLSQSIETEDVFNLSSQLACLTLEAFAKFLRVHPVKKNGFRDFVDTLLEPLLILLSYLKDGQNCNKLSKSAEEVILFGLFHPTLVDGFLTLCSSENGQNSSETKMELRSYHRHFFAKVKSLSSSNKTAAIKCLDKLFFLLSSRVKSQQVKESLKSSAEIKVLYKADKLLKDWKTENKRSIIIFAVRLMEPLLLNTQQFLLDNLQLSSLAKNANGTLFAINSLLAALITEKLHNKCEDHSDGFLVNFLIQIYGVVFSYGTKLISFSVKDHGAVAQEELKSLATTILLSVNFLLEINYEVIQSNIESLWLVMFKLLCVAYPSFNSSEKCPLILRIFDLGCQLIKVYSELRQVDVLVLALCKAVRNIVSIDCFDDFVQEEASILHKRVVKSVALFLCSEEIKLAISHGFEFIPEGQISKVISQIADDALETMEWLKFGTCSARSERQKSFEEFFFHARAELMGRGISEVYAGALDSIIVTRGNSVSVSHSIENFINNVRSYMGSLVQPNGTIDFLTTTVGVNNKLNVSTSSKWIFVYLFRLYISLRSSYKKTIVLLPPRESKKASEVLRDDLLACGGCNWIEQGDPKSESYFSLICHLSASLLDIIHSISNADTNVDATTRFSLEYLFLIMAVERLSDLNRKINASEYALQAADFGVSFKISENHKIQKRKRKVWRQYSMTLKDEALRITDYLLNFSSLPKIDSANQCINLNAWEQSLIEGSSRLWIAGDVSEDSLSIAIWRMLCQNLSLWSTHASKEKTKYFLKLLFSFSLPHVETDRSLSVKIPNKNLVQSKLNQISLSAVNEATFLDHECVSRNLASILCHLLEINFPVLNHDTSVGKIVLSRTNCWRDVVNDLDMFSLTSFIEKESNSCLSGKLRWEVSHSKIVACEWLLGFICRIPGRCMSLKSFSRYAKFLLNFERKIISTLVEFRKDLFSLEIKELTKLFVTTRRTLKLFVAEHCNKKSTKKKFCPIPVFSDDHHSILWLLKSVFLVSERIDIISDSVLRDIFFSLMDHSSQTIFIISRYLFSKGEDRNHDATAYHGTLEGVLLVLESISEQCERSVGSNLYFSENLELGVNGTVNLCSVALSCGGGFLCGLISALENKGSKETLRNWKIEPFSKFECFIGKLAEFSTYFIRIFCSSEEGKSTANGKISLKEVVGNDIIGRNMDKVGDSFFSLFDDLSHQENDIHCSKFFYSSPTLNALFNNILEGRSPEVAILLRNLLITSSAIFRFKRKIYVNQTPPLASLFILSQLLLSKFSDSVVVAPINFIWLDGALQCLHDLAMHIFSNNPAQTRNIYTNVVQLLLKALGKCSSIQGKRARLASHDSELDEENDCDVATSECSVTRYTSEFKAKLRDTVVCLVKSVPELHLLSALQTLERSLVAVNVDCSSVYEIVRVGTKGRASPNVAAAIDFLDLILEHVSGRKRINLVKKFAPSIIAALFNIITHLQSPHIFFGTACDNNSPDPGAVVLMSVEVLTRMTAKHALLRIDSWHIAESLRLPTLLFKEFGTTRVLETCEKSDLQYNSSAIHRHFFRKIFAACCKLLYTTLKHHKSETDRCIALLQESTRNLLCCLEIISQLHLENEHPSLDLQDALQSACFFRRIFEELRQQKDVFGRHCYKFISDYLWIYCGNGPSKCSIRREVDDALRPGIYALLDASAAEDLQYLHYVLGEGPCRITLAALQHDYQLHFRYEGKV